MKGKSKNKTQLHWCFAIINSKLGEIFFDKSKNGETKIHSHCYIKKEEYSKKEQKMLATEATKYCFIWRNGTYKTIYNRT